MPTSDYSIVAIMILIVIGICTAIMILTHLIGPTRTGPVKDTPYESGVPPIGDARQRFNVRYYIVAMLFLLFDVEIVFFYPWATLFPRFNDPAYVTWAQPLIAAGYSPIFFMGTMFMFIAILLVGYVYAWRRGVFRWD
ncbi:MAG: NADH-quinone oxidoreductase subunit A [Phycisphaerae bacterium]